MSSCQRSEWHEDHVIEDIICPPCFEDQLEVVDDLTDGNTLARENNSREGSIRLLPVCRLTEQVIVLAEEDAPENKGTIKQCNVVNRVMVILVRRQNIQSPGSQRSGNSGMNMVVHIQPKHVRHLSLGHLDAFAP
jgi:hypothetical protein